MKGRTFKRCTTCKSAVSSDRHRKRCDGKRTSWAYTVDVGRDPDGRRLRDSRSGFATQRDADRAMREALTKVDVGTHVTRSTTTLADYLRGEWLPATAPPRVAYGTHAKRRGHVDTYIVPRIGGVPLQQLTAAHVDRLYAELLTSGKADGSPLAASTVHDVHRTLRRALKDALRWGLVERDATERADPPPVRLVESERRAAMRVWTADELATFLTTTADHRLGRLFEVAGSTGARRSELCGMSWQDLDLEAGTWTVRRSVVRGEHGYYLGDATKSDRSARTIDLDARTITALKAVKVAQAEARLAAGPAWTDLGVVFTDELGQWLSPPSVTQAFRRSVSHCTGCSAPLDTDRQRERHDASACTGERHPALSFHGLRHTHATLLLKAGVPLHVVSRRLGHASEAFTAYVYAHVLPGQQREAAETFSRLVWGEVAP